MAIFVNEHTKVIVQGLTGGQGKYHGLRNQAYTIAMARTSDPHSASAQFFINVNNNRFLDYPGQDGWGYAVFGKVIRGADVVDKIKSVETDRRDKPLQNVVIESASIIE